MGLNVKVTLEFELSLENPIVTEEDPSPPGVGLPRGKERFVEPDLREVAELLIKEFEYIQSEMASDNFLFEDEELEEVADYLSENHNMNVEIVR